MEDLEARVQRLEKMWENVKNGKRFWIPYPKKTKKATPEKTKKKE